jgi:hypothetical protein
LKRVLGGITSQEVGSDLLLRATTTADGQRAGEGGGEEVSAGDGKSTKSVSAVRAAMWMTARGSVLLWCCGVELVLYWASLSGADTSSSKGVAEPEWRGSLEAVSFHVDERRDRFEPIRKIGSSARLGLSGGRATR